MATRRAVVSIAAALVAAVAATTQAATPLDTEHPRQTVTVDYLLEACSVVGETAYGMIPHFDCESWLYGVLDAVAAGPEATRIACVPADVAPWQVYEKLQSAPLTDAQRAGAAAPWVIEQLRAVYPCTAMR